MATRSTGRGRSIGVAVTARRSGPQGRRGLGFKSHKRKAPRSAYVVYVAL